MQNSFVSGGMFAVPVMLNLFIHVIMYSYYFLSSLGKEWQKRIARWKPKLTIAQMVSTLDIMHVINEISILRNYDEQLVSQ